MGSLSLPPRWNPDMERRSRNPYTFDMWQRNLSVWALATNLRPNQQAAAIAMRLEGEAREAIRDIAPAELRTGGFRNGNQMDPLSLIIYTLKVRFAPLEEETAMRAVTELLSFGRNPGETTDALLHELARKAA